MGLLSLLRRMQIYSKVTTIPMPIFIIDLETTGRENFPENIITELSIVKLNTDMSISVIYDTLIQYPEVYQEIWDKSWWSEISGIKYEAAKNAPTLAEAWKVLGQYINNQLLVSYNVQFDINGYLNPINSLANASIEERKAVINKYNITYKLPDVFIKYKVLKDPMIVATKVTKIRIRLKSGKKVYKFPKLKEIAEHYKIVVEEEGLEYHRAIYDTIVTAHIIRKLIEGRKYKISYSSNS